MLRLRLDGDCNLGGVGMIRAATPESRSAFVAIMVPEFDGNTRTTSTVLLRLGRSKVLGQLFTQRRVRRLFAQKGFGRLPRGKIH
jgi:hypothetical protein